MADDNVNSVIILKNGSYEPIGSIQNGLTGPEGEWVDTHGNLYVADYLGDAVQEYAPGGTSPKHSYSSGLNDPTNVTTDSNGNVFAIDYNFGKPGFVVEFPQGKNTPIHTYLLPGSPEGAAFDASGNLYVDYVLSTLRSSIEEFPHGSTIGRGTGIWLDWVGGMVMDKNGRLLLCNQVLGEIDIVTSPYNKVSARIKGFDSAFQDALNLKANLLFVADPGAGTVSVRAYPSGKLVTTLGPQDGISLPVGIADSPELQ